MSDRLFKAICSDFDMFANTVLFVAAVPLFWLWRYAPFSKTEKLLYVFVLLFAIAVFLLLCMKYFSSKAKEKGIKFVRQAKDSYARAKQQAIMLFATIGICVILFSAADDGFNAILIMFAAVLLVLSLCVVLWIEKRRYRKDDK